MKERRATAATNATPATPDAAARRGAERILEVATRTLTADPRASLGDIARAAGVGRTTVHRYFPTRDALLAALTSRAQDRLEAAFAGVDFDQPFADALAALVAACLPLGPEALFVGRDYTRFLGEGRDRYERLHDRLAATISAAAARGEVRADLPPDWAAGVVFAGLWTGWEWIAAGALAPRDAPRLVAATLLHGIAP